MHDDSLKACIKGFRHMHLLFSAFYYHLLYLTRQLMICAISYSQIYGPNLPQLKEFSC